MPRDETVRDKLSAVKDKLIEAGVRWAVFAGAAAYCYGSRREVTDIDILVSHADLGKANAALKDIEIEGFDVVGRLEIKTNQGTYVFFMDQDMIERIQWKQLFGVTVPIIPVEDNIVFKAILQRGENQGKNDIEDIQQMIKNEEIDLEYLKNKIRKFNAEKRVMPILLSLIPSLLRKQTS